MENKKNLNDIIPHPIKRNLSTSKVFLWFTIKDLILSFIIAIISCCIWIPLMMFSYQILALIIVLLSLVLIVFLTIEIGNTKPWMLIVRIFKYLSAQKEFKKDTIKYDDGFYIRNTTDNTKEYYKMFEIDSIMDTSLLELDTKIRFYNSLKTIFLSINKTNNIEIWKVKTKQNISNLTFGSKNIYLRELISEQNELIDKLNTNYSQDKIIISIYSTNKQEWYKFYEIIKSILDTSFIKLNEVDELTLNQIKSDILFENKNIKVYDNYFCVDKEYYSIITINKFRNQLVGNEWITDLLHLSNQNISIRFFPFTKQQSKKMIDQAISNAKTETTKNKASAIQKTNDQYILETYQAQQTKIAIGEENIINTNSMFIIKAKTKNELKSLKRQLKVKLEARMISIDDNVFNQQKMVKCLLGFDSDWTKDTGFDIAASTLGMGFPFKQNINYDENVFILGQSGTRKPIAIDWKKRDNIRNMSNTVLIGKSGSGKTTSAKAMIKSQVAENNYQVFCIDPENEYGELFKKMGGAVIGADEITINPFYFDKSLGIRLEDHIELLSGVFKMLFGEYLWNDKNKTPTMKVLHKMYSSKAKVLNFTFSDFYKEIKKDKKVEQIFLDKIELFTKDNIYGHLFDTKQTDIKLTDTVCFNFKDLVSYSNESSEIKRAKTLLLMGYLENLILSNLNKPNRKYVSIFVDEGHIFSNSKDDFLIKFFDGLFRRIRKYNGMITYITQNLGDLKNNYNFAQYTKSIINNAHYLFIFHIRKDESDILNEILVDEGGLTNDERNYIAHSRIGDCILFEKNKRTKLRIFKQD